ncbi:MAG: hypothetical protein WC621_04805 [Patescibacteria group bacterium]
MPWPTKKLRELNELIFEGVNITRYAQEGNALYSNNQFLAVDVHNQFVLWRIKVRGFVLKNYPNNISTFFKADSIPDLKGGIEYGDVTSEKSQILLRNIREESSRKIELLEQLKRSAKWWEKSWVQLVMLIGAVASIIGLYLFLR